MANHRRVGDDQPDNIEPPEGIMLRFREPALTATALLAPAVGLLLLFVTDMPPGAQAGWNAVAVAVAGLITSIIAVREKLAPTILGLAQAVISILTVYGFGMSAEQSTGTMAFLALLVGAYVRTQITAPPEQPAPSTA